MKISQIMAFSLLVVSVFFISSCTNKNMIAAEAVLAYKTEEGLIKSTSNLRDRGIAGWENARESNITLTALRASSELELAMQLSSPQEAALQAFETAAAYYNSVEDIAVVVDNEINGIQNDFLVALEYAKIPMVMNQMSIDGDASINNFTRSQTANALMFANSAFSQIQQQKQQRELEKERERELKAKQQEIDNLMRSQEELYHRVLELESFVSNPVPNPQPTE